MPRLGQRRCMICKEMIYPSPTFLGSWANTSTGTLDLCTEHNEPNF